MPCISEALVCTPVRGALGRDNTRSLPARFEGTGMDGTVPAFLSKLPLTELDLSANSFTGESQSNSRAHSPAD